MKKRERTHSSISLSFQTSFILSSSAHIHIADALGIAVNVSRVTLLFLFSFVKKFHIISQWIQKFVIFLWQRWKTSINHSCSAPIRINAFLCSILSFYSFLSRLNNRYSGEPFRTQIYYVISIWYEFAGQTTYCTWTLTIERIDPLQVPWAYRNFMGFNITLS